MDKYIHVAFGVSDPSGDYCKYVATAIYSIVSNTHENVFIHIRYKFQSQSPLLI